MRDRSPSAIRRCASDRADRRGNGRSATPAARPASSRRTGAQRQVMPKRLGDLAEAARASRRRPLPRRRVEGDAHEEIAGLGVVELLRVENVEACSEREVETRRRSRPVGAGQGKDALGAGHDAPFDEKQGGQAQPWPGPSPGQVSSRITEHVGAATGKGTIARTAGRGAQGRGSAGPATGNRRHQAFLSNGVKGPPGPLCRRHATRDAGPGRRPGLPPDLRHPLSGHRSSSTKPGSMCPWTPGARPVGTAPRRR